MLQFEHKSWAVAAPSMYVKGVAHGQKTCVAFIGCNHKLIKANIELQLNDATDG
jgi:hypothetical protein